MKPEHKVVAVALILCMLVWHVDASLRYLVETDVPYLQWLLPYVPERAIFTRNLITTVFLGFTLFIAYHIRIRRETYEQTEQARAELQQVFQTASDAIRVVDHDFTVINANRAFSDLVGKPLDEIIGSKCYESFPCELCDTDRCHLERVIAGERIEQHEGVRQSADGECVCLLSAAPFPDKEGNITGMVESFRDITELNRMHELVSQSEERYRTLAEGSADPIVVLGHNAEVLYANQIAARIRGASTRKDMVGTRVRQVIDPEDREKFVETVNAVVSGELDSFEEVIRFHVDEQKRSYRVLGTPINYDGRSAVLVFAYDITDFLRAQRQIRAERDRAQRYLDIAGTIILVLSPSAEIQLINRYGCELIGASEDELIGLNWMEEFVPADLRSQVRQHFQDILDGKVKQFDSVNALVNRKGQRRIISWDSSLLRDENDNVSGVLTSGRDITQRRRVMQDLATEKERLRVTLWSIGDGVIATDTDGRVQLMNDVAERFTGRAARKVRELPIDSILDLRDEQSGERIHNLISDVLSDGTSVESIRPRRLISDDGTERLVEYSATPIETQENSVILGAVVVLRDVTQREKLYRELEKADRLKSVGNLAAGIAHDFNNHLTAILGNIDLLEILVGSNEDAMARLKAAEKAVMRARDLTQQLLTFAAGGAPVTEAVRLPELIKNAAELALSGSQTRCDIDFVGELPLVDVDEAQARQVVNALLINADEAMPDGGVVSVTADTCTIRPNDVSPLDPGSYAHIAVTDQGPGINTEDADRIFEPFYTTKEDAAGLGLAIAFSIVQRHGGHLEVDTDFEEGARFHVYFPVSRQAPEQIEEEAGELPNGEGRILVMDDQDAILQTTGDLLNRLGYEAEFANGGAEAIEKYQRAMHNGRPFDVAVLDLTIPGGMDGVETLEKLREIDPNVRAIVSSGYSNDPIMADYRSYGFSAVLLKPYKAEQLARTLGEVIGIDS